MSNIQTWTRAPQTTMRIGDWYQTLADMIKQHDPEKIQCTRLARIILEHTNFDVKIEDIQDQEQEMVIGEGFMILIK